MSIPDPLPGTPFRLPPPAPPSRRRVALRWAVLLLFGGLVISWLLTRFETQQLYYPTPLSGDTPAQWGLPYEDVRIETEDGVSLQAWWIPRAEPDAPVMLFLHGNAGNRGDRLHNLQGLWRAGISVLILDYRGYGGSGGAPTEPGLYRDAQAAFDWLAARFQERPIAVFGRSLGAAVAAQLARKRPVAALILESPFTSTPDMAEHLFPIPGLRHVMRTRFDTRAAVREITTPLLVIHGTADEIVPFHMGQAVFDAAASPDKTFRAVQHGHHNDTYVVAGDQYWKWLKDFLGRTVAP